MSNLRSPVFNLPHLVIRLYLSVGFCASFVWHQIEGPQETGIGPPYTQATFEKQPYQNLSLMFVVD